MKLQKIKLRELSKSTKNKIWNGSILAAFIAAAAVFIIMLQAEKKVLAEYEKITVCVTIDDLPKGESITEDNILNYVQTVEIDRKIVPDTAIKNMDEITGRIAVHRIEKGSVVTRGMLESEEQIMEAAAGVKKAGAQFLRGGAYKPRTSPYAFQGMEDEGFKMLRQAADATGLKVVSEVIAEDQMDTAAKYCDMFQIGARNMQNFRLLKAVGRSGVPVLLKRGIASTIEEWLDAAEYIMSEGNYNVVLCERGIRTFETATRNTLDISAVPVIKERSCLPIIVDPSHAAGKSAYIQSLSLAAAACGADGLIIEVHPCPKCAMSDAKQQLTPAQYAELFAEVRRVAQAVGREV